MRIPVRMAVSHTRALRSAPVWSGQKIEWPKNNILERVVSLSNVQNCTRRALSSAYLPGCVRLCVGGCSVFLSAGLGNVKLMRSTAEPEIRYGLETQEQLDRR